MVGIVPRDLVATASRLEREITIRCHGGTALQTTSGRLSNRDPIAIDGPDPFAGPRPAGRLAFEPRAAATHQRGSRGTQNWQGDEDGAHRSSSTSSVDRPSHRSPQSVPRRVVATGASPKGQGLCAGVQGSLTDPERPRGQSWKLIWASPIAMPEMAGPPAPSFGLTTRRHRRWHQLQARSAFRGRAALARELLLRGCAGGRTGSLRRSHELGALPVGAWSLRLTR